MSVGKCVCRCSTLRARGSLHAVQHSRLVFLASHVLNVIQLQQSVLCETQQRAAVQRQHVICLRQEHFPIFKSSLQKQQTNTERKHEAVDDCHHDGLPCNIGQQAAVCKICVQKLEVHALCLQTQVASAGSQQHRQGPGIRRKVACPFVDQGKEILV